MDVNTGRLRSLSAMDGVNETSNPALELMRRALDLLVKDPGISPLVAPQLQLAIDRLICPRASGSRYP